MDKLNIIFLYMNIFVYLQIVHKKTGMSNDLVTIVTVCYNTKDVIEETLRSVLLQNYRPIEYIIIDGLSTDGTMNIVKKYKTQFESKGFIFQVLSERDNGIYDAMNKAISMSTGKWINFMNAGDRFCDENVISDVLIREIPNDIKAIYGNVIRRKKYGLRRQNGAIPESVLNKMPACHQAIFADVQEMKNHPFDLQFKLCADYNFMYNLYKRGGKFLPVSVDVASFDAENGASTIHKLQTKREDARIKGIQKTWSWRSYYMKEWLCFNFKKIVEKFIPQDNLVRIKRWNHNRLDSRKKY